MAEGLADLMQRLHSASSSSSAATSISPSSSSSSSIPRPPPPLDLQPFAPPFRHFSPSFSPDAATAAKRPGIPPIPPSPPSSAAAAAASPFHSRSQPPAFDSLPRFHAPPPPSAPHTLDPMLVDARPPAPRDGLPPRRAHRRSHSDVPFGLPLHSPSPPLPQRPAPSIKQAESSSAEGGDRSKSEVEDLIIAYMDSLDTLNSSGTEEKHEDLVESSRLSGTRTSGADSSENEAESSVNESGGGGSCGGERKEGNKRSAAGDLTPSRHCRSLSMDSFMGKMQFGDESPKFPPSPGNRTGYLSRSDSMDETMNTIGLELGNGEFNSAEMKKIMADEKLSEMALADPKRVKRILANRQSASRSKERKVRYISELEHKVQILQTEATTLSAQLTLLQRDSAGLTSQNNELKFRLQAMEQQAQLKDALNEALSAEVQRLKLATGEISEAQLSKGINHEMQMNHQMFQLHQLQSQQQQKQQTAQNPLYQLQLPQQQDNVSAKLESS